MYNIIGKLEGKKTTKNQIKIDQVKLMSGEKKPFEHHIVILPEVYAYKSQY